MPQVSAVKFFLLEKCSGDTGTLARYTLVYFFCGLFRMLAVTHTVVLNGMMTGVLDRIWLEAATVFLRMDRYTAVFLIPY